MNDNAEVDRPTADDWDDGFRPLQNDADKVRMYLPAVDTVGIFGNERLLLDNGDALAGLRCFAAAIERGALPPVSVLQWLAKAIQGYIDDQGTRSLDQAVGVSSKVFKGALLALRNDEALFDMDRLMFLGATREEAAAMVADRMDREDWNKTKVDMADPSASTLENMHARAWSKVTFDVEQWRDWHGTDHPLRDPIWIAQWLSQFNVLYMPDKLKSMLRKP